MSSCLPRRHGDAAECAAVVLRLVAPALLGLIKASR